jgi:peroxiredoxin family protein
MDQAKLAIILHSASYDRVSYALTLAAMAAAQFKEVSMLFTYGAIRRLVKGHTDEVGEETAAWIQRDLPLGLETGSMKRISEMITYVKGFGGKIFACSAAMTFHHITQDAFLDEVDGVTGISTFLEQAEGGQLLYV